jgi:hypothetical protein
MTTFKNLIYVEKFYMQQFVFKLVILFFILLRPVIFYSQVSHLPGIRREQIPMCLRIHVRFNFQQHILV